MQHWTVIVFGWLTCSAIAAVPSALPGRVDFARDIQPIFAERCHSCHGPEKQKGGLRLDQQARALAGGDSGPAIQPGHGADSLLFKLVSGQDAEKIMPPKGERLTPAQVTLLRRWIDASAPWPDVAGDFGRATATTHWAFRAPQRPAIPAVKNRRWLRNPIDAFVLARLEREHLAPSPEADRPTLIRRLSLDLLGLPPSPEDVAGFVSDARPDAYEQLVDRLLASPHFGERWGRHWLDLARYADSSGYQVDRPRPYAYRYRDWVIDAFNRDQPFDEFTSEQLAGDLLPDATIAQKTAAGFHRNTLMNHEDGVDAEEFRCKAKVDRVSTTGAVWLGLTVGCAQCHTHKYDPIPQREFYQLYAFFNRAEERDVPAPTARDAAALVPTFAERAEPVATFVHVRGDFLRPGDPVQPAGLSVLHPLKARGPQPDRLDLARWVVDPANPLTSRVAVNHVWQHLLGRGLVNTSEDFGARGERPSHPELLDWLAVTFREAPAAPAPGCGWSRKALIKLIVTSATYRQASHGRPELRTRDPENVLLARQNRFRLESEIVRDVQLAAGGLLNLEIGGPSFRPFLPEDVKALGTAGAWTWTDDHGPVTYRRGLYIYAQRTVPYPVLMTFDQANPSEACARRERSNTPLQALTLLNNAVFVECAQALARRAQAASAADEREQISRTFALALGREPSRAELKRLQQLYAEELRIAQSSTRSVPTPAGSAAAVTPEWVALTAVSQVILNLEEFVTRE